MLDRHRPSQKRKPFLQTNEDINVSLSSEDGEMNPAFMTQQPETKQHSPRGLDADIDQEGKLYTEGTRSGENLQFTSQSKENLRHDDRGPIYSAQQSPRSSSAQERLKSLGLYAGSTIPKEMHLDLSKEDIQEYGKEIL
jgi:hypothetical protein